MKILCFGIVSQCVTLMTISFAYGMYGGEADYFLCQGSFQSFCRERGVTETFSHDPEFEELYKCVKSNNFGEFERLLCKKANGSRSEVFAIDINKRITGMADETFLIYLVTEGHVLFVELLMRLRPDLDLNAQCSNGNTALHRAVLNEDCRLVMLLMKDHRIKINIKNDENQTPRYYIKKNKNLEDIFKKNSCCCCIIV